MTPFVLILWVAAIVCWVIAAFANWRAPAPGWGGGLVPLGLALAGSAVVVGGALGG